MNNNLVSIITANYNCEKFIEQTIDSVINQTFKNWELIIIDDFSSDNSIRIINNYLKKDNRIKLIKNLKNEGPAISRNKGIKIAKGKFIAFLDSDDLWHKNKLYDQLNFMDKNNYFFTYTHYNQIDEKNNFIKTISKLPPRVNYDQLIYSNPIGCLTVIINIEKLGKRYMENILKRQDYSLWLQYLKTIEFAYCFEENLGFYRIRKNSISSNKLKLLYYHYFIYFKIEKNNILRSIYYTLVYTLNNLKKK